MLWLPALFAPAVHASCGDWLAHPPAAVLSVEALATSGRGGGPTDGVLYHYRHLTGRQPCQGPACGKAPEHRPPAVPTGDSGQTEHLGLAVHAITTAPTCPPSPISVELEARPVRGFPARIDHPPRIGSHSLVA
jgi:hypothetical protein